MSQRAELDNQRRPLGDLRFLLVGGLSVDELAMNVASNPIPAAAIGLVEVAIRNQVLIVDVAT